MVDLDRRSGEPLRGQDALGVEVQMRCHGIPGAAGLQAGQAVREDLGKHGDHAIGQIHARAPVPGDAVERRSRPHEVRDVGDMDAQASSGPSRLAKARSRRRSRGRSPGRS